MHTVIFVCFSVQTISLVPFFAYYRNMFYICSQTTLFSSMKSEVRWQSNAPLTSFWRSRIILLFLSISVFKKLIYNFKEMLSGSCWSVIVNTNWFFMLLKVLGKKKKLTTKPKHFAYIPNWYRPQSSIC